MMEDIAFSLSGSSIDNGMPYQQNIFLEDVSNKLQYLKNIVPILEANRSSLEDQLTRIDEELRQERLKSERNQNHSVPDVNSMKQIAELQALNSMLQQKDMENMMQIQRYREEIAKLKVEKDEALKEVTRLTDQVATVRKDQEELHQAYAQQMDNILSEQERLQQENRILEDALRVVPEQQPREPAYDLPPKRTYELGTEVAIISIHDSMHFMVYNGSSMGDNFYDKTSGKSFIVDSVLRILKAKYAAFPEDYTVLLRAATERAVETYGESENITIHVDERTKISLSETEMNVIKSGLQKVVSKHICDWQEKNKKRLSSIVLVSHFSNLLIGLEEALSLNISNFPTETEKAAINKSPASVSEVVCVLKAE